MISRGIRELKNEFSQYVRRAESGERIAVTAHGRVVAEIGPPAGPAGKPVRAPFEQLLAAGEARGPLEDGDPLEDWPDLRLPKGTVADLIDEDRGEA